MQKRRDMRRTDWTCILKRDYLWRRCFFQGTAGIASLLVMREVERPLKVCNGEHEVTIAAEGMSWLQIALEDQYVWVTAMFDQHDRLVQVYFDLTDGNCLESPENPTFEDLYLDLVMEPDGRLHLLDSEELDAAFAEGKITEQQYHRTVAEGQKLYQYLAEHWQAFSAFCCEEMSKLKGLYRNGKA